MKKFVSLLVASLALVGLTATSATASPFSVSVSKTTYIAYAGETVTVSLSNIPTDAGFYVRQCVAVETGRPTVCNGQGSWVSVNAGSLSQHAGDASQPISVALVKTFTSGGSTPDCAVVQCEIFVRRDHLAGGDKSFDTHIPLTFSPVGVTLSKSAGLTDLADTIQVTLAGIPTGYGLYVRECQQSSGGNRPTNCNGMGVWTSLDSTSQAQTATDANAVQTLPVVGQFTTNNTVVDCSQVVCGVFIRRDHNGGGNDFSLDMFIPISFNAPVKLTQSITPLQALGAKSVVKGKSVNLASVSLKTNKGQSLTWTTSNTQVCALITQQNKKVVSFKKVGTCVVTARASGTNRLVQKDFKWTFNVKAR